MAHREISIMLISEYLEDAEIFRSHLLEKPVCEYKLCYRQSIGNAERELQQQEPSIIFLDIPYPTAESVGDMERIHACAGSAPVIILTRANSSEFELLALQHGAQDLIHLQHLHGGMIWRVIFYAIERRKREAQLRKQEALKHVKELAGAIAHEFAQPLQIISNTFEFINMEQGQSHRIERCRQMTNRISELLHCLRNINTIEQQNYLTGKILDLYASAATESADVI